MEAIKANGLKNFVGVFVAPASNLSIFSLVVTFPFDMFSY